ncbi:MAG: type I DNA topoisomerase [bacterium]
MAKSLVVVESPAKAKTINRYLGKDYVVKSSKGHIRDLPKSGLGVDVENDFAPQYEVIKGREGVILELREAAEGVDGIYLAPDPDREGEAICWHLKHELEGSGKPIHRVLFNEITKNAVLEAMKHPRDIDMDLVNAQQARRVLDRLVGYKISPLLWKKVKYGLSAGRVQSVAVRLICERERERQAFVPEEYWSITAQLRSQTSEPFEANLIKIGSQKADVKNGEMAERIVADLEGAKYVVSDVKRRERIKKPAPPFTTSKLQQEASAKFGFTGKRTMSIAQRLYEGVEIGGGERVGLITYMRTDSTRISEVAKSEAREYIEEAFGGDYLPPSAPDYSGKRKTEQKIQDAHEAIRPTSVRRDPESLKRHLDGDQYKLYKLVWSRFLASQMRPAALDTTTVDISATSARSIYLLRASGSVVKFPGFMAVYTETQDNGGNGEEAGGVLPDLSAGEELILLKLIPKQHFTQPPARYTDASLVRTLEELGIGRPSTYAPIISTIEARKYVRREGRTLIPTDLGFLINELLVENFPTIVDVGFTANMESDLDKVEEGSVDWVGMVRNFYGPFEETLRAAEANMRDIKNQSIPTDVPCPECGRKMNIRWGKFGNFLACSGYPECACTRDFVRDDGGNIVIVPPEMAEEVCDKCGGPMIVRMGRNGKFLACGNYPKCKNTMSLGIGVKCPKCGGRIVEKKSRRGRVFYGCDRYPNCDFVSWDKPADKNCPNCGSILVEKSSRKRGTYLKCSNRECEYEEEIPKGPTEESDMPPLEEELEEQMV